MTSPTQKLSRPFKKIRPKLRHSLRVTVAAMIAFWVMHKMDLDEGVWMAFSAMQVVQASVGGSVKAVVERTLGTFAGAAYGAAVATVLTPYGLAQHWIILAGIAPMAFLAALYPSFRIAPISVAIVLFGQEAHIVGPIVYAEHRVMEIGIGCIIGMLVSLAVLPSRAHRALARSSAEVLENYAVLLLDLVQVALGKKPYESVEGRHKELRATITKMETQGEDAKRERLGRLTDDPDPDPLLRMIRRLRFDLVMIGRAAETPLPASVATALEQPLTDIAAQAAGLLRDAGGALGKEKKLAAKPELDAAFASFAAALSALHRNHALAPLSDTDTGRVFTLGFTLEHFKENLHDLAERASEFGEDDDKEQ